MINHVVLVGRTGQDPDIRYFESGSVKCRISLAVDRGFGENKQTDWFNIECWGKLAEFVGEYIKKGTSIIVTGQVEIQHWTDQAGNPRESSVIKATDIRFAGSKRESSAA